ncbi:MAG: hypothetical protein ACI837_003286 [Crocinitomicaceae bacterium]|jgi:hypothetical protein
MIHSSHFWKNHFRENLTVKRVNWEQEPTLSETQKEQLLYSLKAWQLGETSDGKHLLKAAKKHAINQNDPSYIEAVELFIKEEQKHGANLGRYIDLLGEERTKSDWGDTLFRKIRYLNSSMELWTIAVVIVESAAQVFYQAIHDASECKLLKEICSDILIDEAHHIKFQNERLHIIFNQKRTYSKTISTLFYASLFCGIRHAVWLGHRKALKAGGVNKKEFMQQMRYKFFNTIKFIYRTEKVRQSSTEPVKAY